VKTLRLGAWIAPRTGKVRTIVVDIAVAVRTRETAGLVFSG
jgi:hypothetical protein